MKVSFLLKEDSAVEEDSITISVIRTIKSKRSQAINAKDVTDLTAVEQDNIKKLIATVEKYCAPGSGATEIAYTL